jgi:hypothetical protein
MKIEGAGSRHISTGSGTLNIMNYGKQRVCRLDGMKKAAFATYLLAKTYAFFFGQIFVKVFGNIIPDCHFGTQRTISRCCSDIKFILSLRKNVA